MLLASNALAGPIQFDRVDVLSEDPGLWVNDDLLRIQQTPRIGVIRYLGQVKVVLSMPVDGVYFGASLASQSLVVEQLLVPKWPVFGYAGVQSSLLLPRGLQAGLSFRHGGLRVGAGISGLSSATWARPDWTVWTFLPTIGLGFGRSHSITEEPVW